MHVPLIDWQNFDEAQFERAYTVVGFARLYNIWTEQEQVTGLIKRKLIYLRSDATIIKKLLRLMT